MSKTGKWLYCPKCKSYPDTIIEVYYEPARETRTWDKEADCYVLEDSSIEMAEFKEICEKCSTKLKSKI